MDGKQIVALFFLAIIIYLLVANASGSNTVIGGLGSALTNETAALQGRSASNGISTIIVPTG